MSSPRLAVLAWSAVFVGGLTCVHVLGSASADRRTQRFEVPIDGLSVLLASEDATGEVSGFDGERWTDWQPLQVENEQDPALRESNLVLFPSSVSMVRVRGTEPAAIHPVRISRSPVGFTVAAAARALERPRILSRSEWGADESLRLSPPRTDDRSETGDNGDTAGPISISEREQACNEAQLHYPNEFTVARVEKAENGKQLRWPLQYSKDVRMLVVHHTAIALTGDTRPGEQKMRALYEYHAKNRGWGDVGYHYLIDEDGQIYEGRAGGDYVVAGHAYCHNINTLGIALMGNFEIEKPTQRQAQSLQWLLHDLAERYGIDLTRQVMFHGKAMDPILGHRDLLKTECPGETMWRALDQVREHARTGETAALVTFPNIGGAKARRTASGPASQTLSALGDTTLTGPPGSEFALSVLFRAGNRTVREGTRAGIIRRSHPRLQVWQEKNDRFTLARRDLLVPAPLGKGESLVMRLKIRMPLEKGTYDLRIGDVRYTLISEGRTLPRQRVSTPQTSQRSSSSLPRPPQGSASIRIRLTDASLAGNTARVRPASSAEIELSIRDGRCQASTGNHSDTGEALRLSLGLDPWTLTSWQKATNRYRGTLECRVLDGQMVLINELPLEQYLDGLAEEPDTEPYEKQRAFAIAARTYAAYYTDPLHRKFPGKPYDGSDSPAEFQLYGGVAFEEQNPRWVEASRATAGQVLTFDGQVIRAPYFSASDGRTRTPQEAGWNNFPFAEIFSSKPDPWCSGESLRGHGVGMSGCGSEGQANEGKTAEQILSYYYPGTRLERR